MHSPRTKSVFRQHNSGKLIWQCLKCTLLLPPGNHEVTRCTFKWSPPVTIALAFLRCLARYCLASITIRPARVSRNDAVGRRQVGIALAVHPLNNAPAFGDVVAPELYARGVVPGAPTVPIGPRVAKRGSGDKKGRWCIRCPRPSSWRSDARCFSSTQLRTLMRNCGLGVDLAQIGSRTTRQSALRSRVPHFEKRQRLFGARICHRNVVRHGEAHLPLCR
jgi:hypothetical protein